VEYGTVQWEEAMWLRGVSGGREVQLALYLSLSVHIPICLNLMDQFLLDSFMLLLS
jgi:hypothetical protein